MKCEFQEIVTVILLTILCTACGTARADEKSTALNEAALQEILEIGAGQMGTSFSDLEVVYAKSTGTKFSLYKN